MAQIVLLSIDRMLAERIERSFRGRAEFHLLQHLEPTDFSGPGVIVLDRSAIPQARSVAAAVADTVSNSAGRPVVLACDTAEPGEVLTAIRAGAADVLPRDASEEEIATVLGRLLNTAMVGQSRAGRLTLVLGADAEASAIIATDIALTHAGEARTTVLLDCTIPKSACETYLDLKSTYGIASAVTDIARLDANLLANSAVRHDPSGLMLLTLDGGTGSEPTGLSAGDLSVLVVLLQTCCAEVVFCAGNMRNAALLRELASLADNIEIVAAQSIIELDATRRLLDQIGIEKPALRKARLLLWDHQPAVLLDGRRMADILEIDTVLGVPTDQAQVRNAVNLGRPLACESQGGSYMHAIHRIANVTNKQSTGAFMKVRQAFDRRIGDRRSGDRRSGAERRA